MSSTNRLEPFRDLANYYAWKGWFYPPVQEALSRFRQFRNPHIIEAAFFRIQRTREENRENGLNVTVDTGNDAKSIQELDAAFRELYAPGNAAGWILKLRGISWLPPLFLKTDIVRQIPLSNCILGKQNQVAVHLAARFTKWSSVESIRDNLNKAVVGTSLLGLFRSQELPDEINKVGKGHGFASSEQALTVLNRLLLQHAFSDYLRSTPYSKLLPRCGWISETLVRSPAQKPKGLLHHGLRANPTGATLSKSTKAEYKRPEYETLVAYLGARQSITFTDECMRQAAVRLRLTRGYSNENALDIVGWLTLKDDEFADIEDK